MLYRAMGGTGKEVSAIGFGGMRFRPEDYKNGPEYCGEILLRAHELGVNYFDTAPGYCNDKSEDIVGWAMRQIRGTRPYVSTKCGSWNASNAQEAYDQIRKSRDRLGVEVIDFYHMWCIRALDRYWDMVRPGGIYEGMVRAQQDGLISHICCSIHVDSQELLEIIKDGRSEVITLGYNALNFAFRQAGLRACHEAGLGVVVMNPLGGGLIPQLGEQFSFLKRNPAESVVHAALRFLLGHEEISCALPGPSNIAELEESVAAADRAYTVSAEVFEALSKHMRDELDTLCTSCGYCDACPVGVEIVKFLDIYNCTLLGDLDPSKLSVKLAGDWALTPADAAACTQCGVCEPLCTQRLPIMDRLKEIATWPKAK